MSRFTRVCVILGAVILVAGLVLGGLGCGLGAVRDLQEGVCAPYGPTETLDIPVSDLSELEISLISEDVVFSPSPDDQIHITYTPTEEFTYSGKLLSQNGKTVYRFSVQKKELFGIHILSIGSRDVTVQVPADCGLDLSLSSVSGEVALQDLTFGRVQMSTVSGDYSLQSIMVESLDLSTTSGEVTGSLTLRKNGAIHTVSGDVDLDLTGSPEHRYSTGTVSGDVTVPDHGGDLSFSVTTTSGDIRIKD